MEKSCRKSSYCLKFSLVSLLFLSACGLPTQADYCPPPIVKSRTGSTAIIWLPSANSDNGFAPVSRGFVLYYKVIPSGTITDDEFSKSGVGEQVFASLGYSKAFRNNNLPMFVWTPSSSIGDNDYPIIIELTYSNNDPTIGVTVSTQGGQLLDSLELYRDDGKSTFNAIKTGDSDASGETGIVDISLAVMNFNLNSQTISLNPSVGVFVDRISGAFILP